jgi:spore coat polysaccharide biosynthesis protein SpsF
MSIGIVLQARLGSTRLPGKVLRPLLGRPMLAHVIERLRRVRKAQLLILAVPEADQEPLAAIAGETGVACFAGAEADVLDRYYQAARRFALDHVLRATGDNPLVDPAELDRLVDFHLEGGFEYSENFTVLPPGAGGEIFSFGGLERCWRLSTLPHQREGVNDYILEHPGEFRRATLAHCPYEGVGREVDCTVDTAEQFGGMERLYQELYRPGQIIPTARALSFLKGKVRP